MNIIYLILKRSPQNPESAGEFVAAYMNKHTAEKMAELLQKVDNLEGNGNTFVSKSWGVG